MSGLRQAAGGLSIALAVILIVGISLSSALAENRLLAPIPTATPIPPTPVTPPPDATRDFSETAVQTKMVAATPSPTRPAPPTRCPAPQGWVPYLVQEGDTIEGLAQRSSTSTQDIATANCLSLAQLLPDTIIYLPPLPPAESPSPTATTAPTPLPSTPIVPCGPPSYWVTYIVQPGDTLFSLAQKLNTSVSQLQFANCLGGSTYIQAGKRLWVPFIPAAPTSTRTPEPTNTNPPAPTSTPTPTEEPTLPPTSPPTGTPTPTDTATPTPSPTANPPTPTPTVIPPSATPTGTASPSPAPVDQL